MKSRDLVAMFVIFSAALITTVHAQSVDFGCCDQKSSGIVGGAEVTLFRLHATQGAGGNSGAGNTDDYFPGYGFNAAGRYWFGYEAANGLGLRARFFQWQQSKLYNSHEREQEFEIYDVEATLDTNFCNWEFTGIGGVRWGSILLNGSDFGETNTVNFNGTGLTIGGELRRPVWRNLSLIGGARYSVLYGQTDFLPVSTSVLDNTFVDITEVRLGVEWQKQMTFGGRLFANAAWEHQVYGTDSYLVYAIDPETVGDVSLAGPVFSIGINR